MGISLRCKIKFTTRKILYARTDSAYHNHKFPKQLKHKITFLFLVNDTEITPKNITQNILHIFSHTNTTKKKISANNLWISICIYYKSKNLSTQVTEIVFLPFLLLLVCALQKIYIQHESIYSGALFIVRELGNRGRRMVDTLSS